MGAAVGQFKARSGNEILIANIDVKGQVPPGAVHVDDVDRTVAEDVLGHVNVATVGKLDIEHGPTVGAVLTGT